jgi:hypothetical protein
MQRNIKKMNCKNNLEGCKKMFYYCLAILPFSAIFFIPSPIFYYDLKKDLLRWPDLF